MSQRAVEAFSKYQVITYNGKAIYTVDLSKLDADDISLPDRFKKQSDFLDRNPDIAVCGCETEFIGNVRDKQTYTVFGKENMKVNMLFSSCVCHPAVMLRKAVFDKENYRYDNYYDKIEDYELWTRIIMKYNMDNVNGILFQYRVHDSQVTQNYSRVHKARLKELKEKQLKRLGVGFTTEESGAFFDFCSNDICYENQTVPLAALFEKIYKRNETSRFFDDDLLKRYIKTILLGIIAEQDAVIAEDILRSCSLINKKDLRVQKLKSWIKACIRKD